MRVLYKVKNFCGFELCVKCLVRAMLKLPTLAIVLAIVISNPMHLKYVFSRAVKKAGI